MTNDEMLNRMANAQAMAAFHVLRSYPLGRMIDAGVRNDRKAKAQAHANPLLRHGEKYFSQNDEDGILLEILRRTGLAGGTFFELGVGNGLENNTLILLMSGWRGAWAGGEQLAFPVPVSPRPKLVYQQGWITRENAWLIWTEACRRLDVDRFDLLSVDLDGNDLHILGEMMGRGARPSVVVVEYNGKFPPPIRFCIDYDPAHRFQESDYFGASLQSFADLLGPLGYRLVACNITGLNAFFVADRFAGAFADVPSAIGELFVPADYGVIAHIGHPTSPRTIASFLAEG